jgi:hypothetical protein
MLINIGFLFLSELTNTSFVQNHSQPAQIQTTSASGAVDWSKIAFDDDLKTIFHQEEKMADIPTRNPGQSSTFHHSIEQPSTFGR